MDDDNRPLLPGIKKVNVLSERITVLIPAGLHSEIVNVMTREQKWVDRQEFIRQAIREKVERWQNR
jgi:metal-responsive CopG/Arc/MetJ family transcriptional regulator